MKYFTVYELTRSANATRLGIDNTPTGDHQKNLELLVNNVLDKVRAFYGKPVIVTSGYRSWELNAATPGSSSKSQHSKGEAADIVANDVRDNHKLFDYIKNHLDFDQLIWEKGTDSNPGWVHVSYNKYRNRKQVLKTKDGKTYINYV